MERLWFTLTALVLLPFCSGDFSEFCHQLTCPEYTVVQKYETFEQRDYAAMKWVRTNVDGTEASDLMAASSRLKAFWKAQNDAGLQIPDTWPILITQTGTEDAPVYSLSWFLPPGFDPKLSDTSVSLESRAAGTVYVRTYGGAPSTSSSREEGERLKADLTNAGITFDSQTSTGAFYDSFFSFSHHNEIWFFAA